MEGGKKLFGKVDQVKDQFYVATLFQFIGFFPCIPLQTYLVIDGTETEQGFHGFKLSMSAKSVFAAYLRAFSILIGGFTLIRGMVILLGNPEYHNEAPMTGVTNLVIGAFCWFVFGISYPLLAANAHRAAALAHILKNENQDLP
ncbi:MAG: hypothetical protein K1Y36_02040 [Blastocatellia bacterium]|nr:hypothetical protein [Blastocatellia bacterium]